MAGVLLAGGAAHAERLNYAFGFLITSAVGTAAEDYAAGVEERSGGTVTIRNFPMPLLSLLETGPGLRDLTGKESLAYAGAITQYTLESCPECLPISQRRTRFP